MGRFPSINFIYHQVIVVAIFNWRWVDHILAQVFLFLSIAIHSVIHYALPTTIILLMFLVHRNLSATSYSIYGTTLVIASDVSIFWYFPNPTFRLMIDFIIRIRLVPIWLDFDGLETHSCPPNFPTYIFFLFCGRLILHGESWLSMVNHDYPCL